MADEKRLVIIDGMALAYRGFFALIRNPRITTYNLNTSAVYVFTNVLIDLLQREKPDFLAVAFDTSEPTFRHKEYEEYKATREKMPEDLSKSMPYLDRLCEAFRIPTLRYPGWEADDVIGTFASHASENGVETYMVTPDKDFTQLVSETARLVKPAKGGGLDVLGVKDVCGEWGIERPEQIIDILALMGDSSDNIPGVPGIGKKTAQKLVETYGSVEGIYDNLDELSGKQKTTLEENRESAFLSKRLVTIATDIPREHSLEDLAVRGWDEEQIKGLFKELEFKSIGGRLFGEEFGTEVEEAGGLQSELKSIEDVEHTYRLVSGAEEVRSLVKELQSQKSVCFDLETTALDAKAAKIVGIAFSWNSGTGAFVSFPDEYGELLDIIEPFFADEKVEKIGHNLKYDMLVLRWHGVRVEGTLFDTMIASYLCTPTERRTMDELSRSFLSYSPVSIETLIGEKGPDQKSMKSVPIEDLVEYATEDADVTLQLAHVFRNKVEELGQKKTFYEIECPLIRVLVEMEYSGIRVDTQILAELSEQLEKEIESTKTRIEKLAGESFNLNSPKQLGEVLFDRLGLEPKPKRTKKTGQYVTNEQVLTRLAAHYEIAEKILEYRMKAKLKSTYVDMLPGTIFPETGRVHTSYEQAVTATGRMNSHDPNLQNIPVRSDQGREIRKAFVAAGDDHLLFAADYSQIELRIAAALSGEKAMIEAFTDDADIHSTTAMKLFGVEADDVTPEMRRHAKTVNFGILYGISAFGLSDRSELSRGEAAELIENYFAQYPALKEWQEETIEFAHENGYVETVTGRRRYLRDINSRNNTVRSAAERNAINSPIQGTAADMIKLAMVRIQERLDREKFNSRMLLQVHDELVFDMHNKEQESLPPLVVECMENALPLDVPIAVEYGSGWNWLDAH